MLCSELIWREAFEGFEPAGEIVSGDEIGQMPSELVVGLVIEALDGGFLDRPVHPLDLAIGPGMLCLGCAMLDVVPGAGEFEGMSAE